MGTSGQNAPRVPSVRRPPPLLVEVKVQSLGLDSSSNTPVVILQEINGDRVLPIWIGPSEARAIAMQMADMAFSRPLTHDLFCSLLQGLGGTLKKVVVTRVEDATYYAELLVERDGELISVDARPSDSIAVALRAGARVFVQNSLLETGTIELTEDSGVVADLLLEDHPDRYHEAPSAMGPEELQEHLKRLNPEDFGRFTP